MDPFEFEIPEECDTQDLLSAKVS